MTPTQVSGVWDGVNRTTIDQGMGAGDTRIEKQEWHLTQMGDAIAGYYIAALTFVSGDGRPYVCSRQPQFSTVQRFDVSGRVRSGAVEIDEVTQRAAQGKCDPGARRLTHYSGRLQGDVLTLVSEGLRQTLYRNHAPGAPAGDIDLGSGNRATIGNGGFGIIRIHDHLGTPRHGRRCVTDCVERASFVQVQNMDSHEGRLPFAAGHGPGRNRDRPRTDDGAKIPRLVVLHRYLDISLRHLSPLVGSVEIRIGRGPHGDHRSR